MFRILSNLLSWAAEISSNSVGSTHFMRPLAYCWNLGLTAQLHSSMFCQ